MLGFDRVCFDDFCRSRLWDSVPFFRDQIANEKPTPRREKVYHVANRSVEFVIFQKRRIILETWKTLLIQWGLFFAGTLKQIIGDRYFFALKIKTSEAILESHVRRYITKAPWSDERHEACPWSDPSLHRSVLRRTHGNFYYASALPVHLFVSWPCSKVYVFFFLFLAVQSEYLAAKDERRAFVTGFDGSAGTAVILTDKAYLWVDSRYHIQAEKQVDPQLWTVMKDGKSPSHFSALLLIFQIRICEPIYPGVKGPVIFWNCGLRSLRTGR